MLIGVFYGCSWLCNKTKCTYWRKQNGVHTGRRRSTFQSLYNTV